MELWEDCLEEKFDSETKSRIIGVKSQMGTFEYYFGLHLGFLIFGHTDNFSRSLQGTEKSAAQGQTITSMTVKTLISLRSDDSFKLYWQKVSREGEELKAISKPKLPRKRRVPKRLDDGTAPFRSSTTRRRSLQKYLFPNLRCGDELYWKQTRPT